MHVYVFITVHVQRVGVCWCVCAIMLLFWSRVCVRLSYEHVSLVCVSYPRSPSYHFLHSMLLQNTYNLLDSYQFDIPCDNRGEQCFWNNNFELLYQLKLFILL